MTARRHASQRGSALLAVLLLAILVEGSVLLAILEVQRTATRHRIESDRASAMRLAESGLERGLAALAVEPDVEGTLEGRLIEGSFAVTIARDGDTLSITSAGRLAADRHTARLELLLKPDPHGLIVLERRASHSRRAAR